MKEVASHDKWQIENAVGFKTKEIYQLLFENQEASHLRFRSWSEFVVMAQQVRVVTLDQEIFGTYALIPFEQSFEVGLIWLNWPYRKQGRGRELIALAVKEAKRLEAKYVFGCTISDKVEFLFAENGFVRVAKNEVSAMKWVGYPADRQPKVMKLNLANPRETDHG